MKNLDIDTRNEQMKILIFLPTEIKILKEIFNIDYKIIDLEPEFSKTVDENIWDLL